MGTRSLGRYVNDVPAFGKAVTKIVRSWNSRSIDSTRRGFYGQRLFMKLFLKTIFLLAIAALLVNAILHNRGTVSFAMPPILPKAITQPAAIMYFAFFAVGFITATVLSAGGGKKGSSGGGGSSKPAKPKLVK
jgi:hypothetical protein